MTRPDARGVRADYVRRLVERAPELTPAQRDQLAVLLRPTTGRTS